jgi:hypothetical protein
MILLEERDSALTPSATDALLERRETYVAELGARS